MIHRFVSISSSATMIALALHLLAASARAQTMDPRTLTATVESAGAAAPLSGMPARELSFESARTMALGSGSRATSVGTSAALSNPANLTLQRLYHVESLLGYSSEAGQWSIGGCIADSITNKIAAGLSFRGLYGGSDPASSGWEGRLALALPVSEALSIGLSGRYLRFDPGSQADGAAGTAIRGFTMDAAIRISASPQLQIAALAYNFIDLESSLVPVLLGGGLGLAPTEGLSIGADFLVDTTTFAEPSFVVGGGVEYLAGGSVPLRIGYRHDTGRRLGQISAAIGFVDQRMGFDVALRRDVLGGSATELLLAARYHVQ
ncbi:MAG: hypothetical protein OEY14_14475 [Myxococcales bacterium]|nr:hypothetical protein [Myxococcales bacterium]